MDLLEEVIIDMHYLWGVSLKTWTLFFVVNIQLFSQNYSVDIQKKVNLSLAYHMNKSFFF